MVSSIDMSSDQVEWNMANLLNIELAKLRSQANTYFISGKYKNAVDSLVTMKMTGVHAMDKDERNALEEKEKELEQPILDYSRINSFNPEDKIAGISAIIKLRKIFMEYNIILMDTLHAHGFLGTYKKDGGIMKI